MIQKGFLITANGLLKKTGKSRLSLYPRDGINFNHFSEG
jgi:hypothetical protein